VRALRIVFAALIVLLCVPVAALAHGDASTHYLETGDFYPGFSVQRASPATELKLMGLLEAAKKAGYPIKVSIIGDLSDVNDRAEMLTHPQRYANFVTKELALSRTKLVGPVVIISPSGIGVAGPGAEKVAVKTSSNGEQNVAAAMTAVRQLSQSAGHPLPANVPPLKVPVLKPANGPGSGYDLSGLTPFAVFVAIFGSAVLYLHIRARVARRRVPGGDRDAASLEPTFATKE
jgi:hypothetical protein